MIELINKSDRVNIDLVTKITPDVNPPESTLYSIKGISIIDIRYEKLKIMGALHTMTKPFRLKANKSSLIININDDLHVVPSLEGDFIITIYDHTEIMSAAIMEIKEK